MNKIQTKDHLFAIIACLLWSSAFTGVKIALNYASPLFLAGIRFILAGLMVAPVVFFRKGSYRWIRHHWRYTLIVSFFQTFLLYLLFFTGIKFVSGATGALIIGSSPLWTALTTHILTKDDRLDRRKILVSILGIAGLALIILTGQTLGVYSLKELTGIGLLAGCGIVSSAGSLLVKKKPATVDLAALSSLQLFLGGIMLFILSLFIEGAPVFPTLPQFYIALGWLSFLSAAAFTLWFLVVSRKHVLVSDISMWKFIIPIGGAVLSWLLLPEESPSVLTITGIIVVSTSLLIFFAKKKDRL